MNSEMLRECQKTLQAEHQQFYCERKRQIEKENAASSKRTKEITDEIIKLSPIPKAHIYPWISLGLHHHTLGNMTYKCNECGAMMWLDERINKSVKLPVFSTCCAKGKIILLFLQELPSPLNTLLTETDPHSYTECIILLYLLHQ
jgi:hypothetical protein